MNCFTKSAIKLFEHMGNGCNHAPDDGEAPLNLMNGLVWVAA